MSRLTAEAWVTAELERLDGEGPCLRGESRLCSGHLCADTCMSDIWYRIEHGTGLSLKPKLSEARRVLSAKDVKIQLSCRVRPP